MFVIEPSSRVRDVRRAFAGGHPRPTLSSSMSQDDLKELAVAHQESRCRFELFEMIASHPSADDKVLEHLLGLQPGEGTANAVVVSPRASKHILDILSNSPYPSVSEHARFGLLKLTLEATLENATEQQLRDIYESHSDGTAESLAVRLIMALHPKTPPAILESLSHDVDSMIAQRALDRLSKLEA